MLASAVVIVVTIFVSQAYLTARMFEKTAWLAIEREREDVARQIILRETAPGPMHAATLFFFSRKFKNRFRELLNARANQSADPTA